MTDLRSLSTLFERFHGLVMAVVASLAFRVGDRAVPGDFGLEADRRLRRSRNRVERLFLMLRDGTLGAWLERSARRLGFRVSGRVGQRKAVSMPARVGWLVGYMPCTERYRDSGRYYAGMLTQLLEAPAVRRILAEHPEIGLAMRPVCRALGVDRALYLDVKAPTDEEIAAAPAFVPPPPPPPEPLPPAPFGVIPWHHQKWAQ